MLTTQYRKEAGLSTVADHGGAWASTGRNETEKDKKGLIFIARHTGGPGARFVVQKRFVGNVRFLELKKYTKSLSSTAFRHALKTRNFSVFFFQLESRVFRLELRKPRETNSFVRYVRVTIVWYFCTVDGNGGAWWSIVSQRAGKCSVKQKHIQAKLIANRWWTIRRPGWTTVQSVVSLIFKKNFFCLSRRARTYGLWGFYAFDPALIRTAVVASPVRF